MMTSPTAAGTSAFRLAALHLRRDKDADFTISCQVGVLDISPFDFQYIDILYIDIPDLNDTDLSILYKHWDVDKDTDFTLSFQGNNIAAHSFLLAST